MKTSLPRIRAIQLAACVIIVFNLAFNVANAGTSSGLVFTDITDQADVAMQDDLTESVAWADYDNDGDPDIYLTNDGPDKLFRNDGGGNFTDVTEAAGLGVALWSDAVAFGDFDNDGDLDFYAVNPDVGLDLVYRNDGGRFTDMSSFSLDGDTPSQRGICVLDFDHDGLVDIYVIAIGTDFLYRNLGNFEFEEVGKTVGAYSDGWGVGTVATDPGGGPVFVPNRFYENIDGATFVDVAEETQTEDLLGYGVSCNAADINNDGWEDFFVTNGALSDVTTPSVMYLNNQNRTFSEVSSVLGSTPPDSCGVAFADFDLDRHFDLLVTGAAGFRTRLWRNDTPTDNHWITIALEGTHSNRSDIGARIDVTTDIRTTMKVVSGGAGRGSFNDLPVEFGLGEATEIVEILITWPSGIVQTLTEVGMDQRIDVVEPGSVLDFTRGNANLDATTDMTDGMHILRHLFLVVPASSNAKKLRILTTPTSSISATVLTSWFTSSSEPSTRPHPLTAVVVTRRPTP